MLNLVSNALKRFYQVKCLTYCDVHLLDSTALESILSSGIFGGAFMAMRKAAVRMLFKDYYAPVMEGAVEESDALRQSAKRAEAAERLRQRKARLSSDRRKRLSTDRRKRLQLEMHSPTTRRGSIAVNPPTTTTEVQPLDSDQGAPAEDTPLSSDVQNDDVPDDAAEEEEGVGEEEDEEEQQQQQEEEEEEEAKQSSEPRKLLTGKYFVDALIESIKVGKEKQSVIAAQNKASQEIGEKFSDMERKVKSLAGHADVHKDRLIDLDESLERAEARAACDSCVAQRHLYALCLPQKLMRMIKAYVTGGAKCGGGGKMPKPKKAEDEMTTHDYSSLAQSHVILATQRFDKIGGRINSLQEFASVPKVGYGYVSGRLGALRGIHSRFRAPRCLGGRGVWGVAQAHAPYTLDPSHVTHTKLSGEQAARKHDRERAKRDISAFNQARASGGVKGAIATSRWERSSKKFAWSSKVAISESEDDTGDAESKGEVGSSDAASGDRSMGAGRPVTAPS